MSTPPRKMLILGLGESGLAMARLAAREGHRLSVADSREMLRNSLEIARFAPHANIVMGQLPLTLIEGVDMVAVSPGLSLNEDIVREALARGIEVVGEIELFARHLAGCSHPGEVVAITGTNGKTTVTSMVGDMAARAGRFTRVAGNISPAASDVLVECEELDTWPDLWVLELSSFQLETTSSLHPAAAAVLNLTEDHLDRYASIEEYAAAKARIFAGPDCVQVLNRQDPRVMAMAQPGREVMSFGSDAPVGDHDFGMLWVAGGPWFAQGKKPLMPRSVFPLPGEHNVQNALAALALGHAIGLPIPSMLESLRNFRGLPHRMEFVASLRGVDFFDDSKGTNVGATVAALQGLERKVVLIAGGDGKGQDFSPLKEAVAQAARAVVLIGCDAEIIKHAIAGAGVPIVDARDMEEAVARCVALAQKGDAILLSPACASFDMFRSYEHRAQVFVDAVHALIAREEVK